LTVAHDPTQKDRQGNDVGRQYRSAIFYANDEQRRIAEAYIAQLDRSGAVTGPIVTEVAKLDRFYRAEDYHQDYAARHPLEPYILFTARPKVDKVRKYFAGMLARR
jgi:peptide-methionine (S)-S-oxide reductase